MKRFLFLLLCWLALAGHAQAQSGRSPWYGSTKANQEMSQALTDNGIFGAPRNTTVTMPTCSAGNEGAIRADTTLHLPQYCNGTAWGWYLGTVTSTGTITAMQFQTTRQAVSASAHAFTCNWNLGAVCAVTLQGTSADTGTLSNPVTGGRYLLELIQPSGVDGTVTWPGTVHWPGAVAPTLTTTDAQVDIVSCYLNGTSYFCGAALNFLP